MKAETYRTEIQNFDVIILGTGPGGLQAAIHASRKKVNVLVMGRPESSSLYKAHIENYCCVEGVKTGQELLDAGMSQAASFGVKFLREDAVATSVTGNGMFEITSEDGGIYRCHSLIFATGVSRKGLGLKGEKDLVGRGVSYCVDCDANFYRDASVAVTGGGSAAVHGALTLERLAREVTLITDTLDVSHALRKELDASKVDVLKGRKVKKLIGKDKLTGIELDDGTVLDLDGLFIERGAKGAMELAAFLGVNLDPEKFTFILTDEKQSTNIPGIFAAGDICGPPFQMAKAVGEGCVAGMHAALHVKAMKRKEDRVDNT